MAQSGPKLNSLLSVKKTASVSRAVLWLQEAEWRAVPDLGACGEAEDSGEHRAQGYHCFCRLLCGGFSPTTLCSPP